MRNVTRSVNTAAGGTTTGMEIQTLFYVALNTHYNLLPTIINQQNAQFVIYTLVVTLKQRNFYMFRNLQVRRQLVKNTSNYFLGA
jgi:hypothetical protein